KVCVVGSVTGRTASKNSNLSTPLSVNSSRATESLAGLESPVSMMATVTGLNAVGEENVADWRIVRSARKIFDWPKASDISAQLPGQFAVRSSRSNVRRGA